MIFVKTFVLKHSNDFLMDYGWRQLLKLTVQKEIRLELIFLILKEILISRVGAIHNSSENHCQEYFKIALNS